MQEHGLKISELVTLFNLEVLNRGSDYDTALLTITDVNRPGLQFHSFSTTLTPAASRCWARRRSPISRG